MGVYGLTSYIYGTVPGLFKDFELRDTRVIIDGNGLLYELYYNSNIDFSRGGDYDLFFEYCQKFFETLRRCNIKPYVLSDGGIDEKKFAKCRSRTDKRIKEGNDIANGKKQKKVGREELIALPPLAEAVLFSVLKKEGIPFCVCNLEADWDIMSLARMWKNYPVISGDSDFLISNLKAGVIPFINFDWKKVKRNDHFDESTGTGSSPVGFIPCKLYKVKKLAKHFKIKMGLLPLFAILQGNDLVEPADFNFSHICSAKGRNRMKDIVSWLSGFKDVVENAKKEACKNLSIDEKKYVETCIDKYITPQNDCSSIAKYLEEEEKQTNSEMESNEEIPGWFLLLHRKGMLSFLHCLGCVTLPELPKIIRPTVEDCSKPSCSNSSLFLRRLTYYLLWQGSQEQPKPVIEYRRKDGEITAEFYKIQPLEDLPNYSLLPNFQSIPSMTKQEKEKLVLAALGVPFEDVSISLLPDTLRLPLSLTVYWIQKSDPAVSISHLLAILLCIMRGFYLSIEGRPTYSYLETRFCENNKSKIITSLVAIQGFAQWQSCLKYTMSLNALLQIPFPAPDPSRLYNGTFAHSWFNKLEYLDQPPKDWIKEELLADLPAPSELPGPGELFDLMLSFVERQDLSKMISRRVHTPSPSVPSIQLRSPAEIDEEIQLRPSSGSMLSRFSRI